MRQLCRSEENAEGEDHYKCVMCFFVHIFHPKICFASVRTHRMAFYFDLHIAKNCSETSFSLVTNSYPKSGFSTLGPGSSQVNVMY